MEHQTLGWWFDCPISPATQREFILDWQISIRQDLSGFICPVRSSLSKVSLSFGINFIRKTRPSFAYGHSPNYKALRAERLHCCLKYPRNLREKTSSEKYTVFSLRKQWKVFAEGNAFRLINAIVFRGQNQS